MVKLYLAISILNVAKGNISKSTIVDNRLIK